MENALWHGLYVRQHFERVVALHLEKRSLETFVPFRRIRRLSNRKPSTEVPLFPGYVFCKCDVAALRLTRTIPGVLAVLQRAELIDIAQAQKIEDFRRLVNSGLPYERWPYSPGRCVAVEDGPLRGITGILVDTTPKHRLVLSIPFIRRSVAVKIDGSWRLAHRVGVSST